MINSIISLFTILILSISGPVKDEINYSNKRINKEIQNTFEIESGQYQRIELDITNPADIGDGIFGKYFAINNDDKLISYLYIGRVPTCPVGGCDSDRPGTGAFEYFDYMILFNTDISVKRVTVFNYQAVRGHEICSRGWLKQFNGYDGESELKVGYNIDAVSGATKSTNSITENLILVQKQFAKSL